MIHISSDRESNSALNDIQMIQIIGDDFQHSTSRKNAQQKRYAQSFIYVVQVVQFVFQKTTICIL